MIIDESVMRTMHDAADLAGTILRQRFRNALTVMEKSDASPVTAVDREVEQAMRQRIAAAHPAHQVIGEEYGETTHPHAFQWVIDPIDGTRAFITGRPSFTTLIAVLNNGTPVAGLIDQPITRERWFARAGYATEFTSDVIPCSVKTRPTVCNVSAAELSCTAPEMHNGDHALRFAQLKTAARRTTWGGDAYAYGLLALGHIDLIAESDMKFWDWAALVPIIEGAGGCITDWQGKPLCEEGDGTVLASANSQLHADAVRCLKKPSRL